MDVSKWPKQFPALTAEQQTISNDFMKHWHEVLGSHSQMGFGLIERFNHRYVLPPKNSDFTNTLEIGAGLGEHLAYEKLTPTQRKNYVAVELRHSMAEVIKKNHPEVQVEVADCQKPLAFADGHFDRILAIHVLEHLNDLPATIAEMYRLCNKDRGVFSVVIPCEGGLIYTLARKVSAQRIFERRYKQSYKWFIEREHINLPWEIREELSQYFDIRSDTYFPLRLPSVNLNLCIGLTLHPKKFIG